MKADPTVDVGNIGKNINELRLARDLSLRDLAARSGYSAGHLSKVERGLESCDSRTMINALAKALRVAPSELTSEPLAERDPVSREAHEGIEKISAVLGHNRLGHPYRDEPGPWPKIEADVHRLNTELHPNTDYVAQAQLLPGLIERLYAAHATDPAHRRDALVGLMSALHHASALLKNLGAQTMMPTLAAWQMFDVANELEDPAWVAVADWRLTQSSGADRDRMFTASVRAANKISGNSDPRAQQACAMLHLNASMAAATMRSADDARSHLAEAREMAKATEGAPDFANMHFNAANWGVWRVSVGLELGEGPKVAELARDVDVSQLLSNDRKAMLYGDAGRGLAQSKRTRDQAVELLRKAEDIAPQRVRTHPLIRETVGDLMRRSKRDAAGRELRGLAWRMGLPL